MKVLTIVGMPGAGKSYAVDFVKNKGVPSVYFGGITLDELKKQNQDINETNEKRMREGIRGTEGKDAYAKRIIKQIEELGRQGHDKVVVDGLYSWSEYKLFEQHFKDSVTFVAIAAPRKSRHQRLKNRPVRPLTEKEVTTRDYAEIENLEKGGPIANADYTIVNDGTPEQLIEKFDRLLHEVKFL